MPTIDSSLDRFLAAHSRYRHAPQSAVERRLLLEALDDAGCWPDAAASLLADLGYRLVEPEPGAGDDSHLLVALRAAPTLRHFDPESIAYYAPTGRVASLVSLTRGQLLAARSPDRHVLWGHVHVADRIPVEKRFLTFGGDLRIASPERDLTVLDLWSPAPIVRWGGHSEPTEDLAEAIGAFFGRLIVPVDFQAGAAERIDATLAEVLYRAFLIDHLDRQGRASQRHAPETDLDAWIRTAWHRAREDRQASWAAEGLLEGLGLRLRPSA
jgi:hypothetical protein